MICSFEPLRPGRRPCRHLQGGRVAAGSSALLGRPTFGAQDDAACRVTHTESRSGGSELAVPPSAHAPLLPLSLPPVAFPLSFLLRPPFFGSPRVGPPSHLSGWPPVLCVSLKSCAWPAVLGGTGLCLASSPERLSASQRPIPRGLGGLRAVACLVSVGLAFFPFVSWILIPLRSVLCCLFFPYCNRLHVLLK